MPTACILLYAASVGAPLALFAVLIWSGIERRLETAARERLARERMMPATVPGVLVLPRLVPVALKSPDRSVA